MLVALAKGSRWRGDVLMGRGVCSLRGMAAVAPTPKSAYMVGEEVRSAVGAAVS